MDEDSVQKYIDYWGEFPPERWCHEYSEPPVEYVCSYWERQPSFKEMIENIDPDELYEELTGIVS
jgi:hypothetical protein